MNLKRLIGDRDFYRRLFSVMAPVLVQNVITNFVSLLDNVMVGQVGTEPMSGVAIVNQLIFIFNLCIFGGLAGAGIFTAQFHGKGTARASGTPSASSSLLPPAPLRCFCCCS